MNYNLYQMFAILGENTYSAEDLRFGHGHEELFAETSASVAHNDTDMDIISALYAEQGMDISLLPEAGRSLFELSVNAFDSLVHAWMSEFPLDAEMFRYGRRVLASAAQTALNNASGREGERRAADIAAVDRCDADTRAVLEAAYKVRHEVDRLRGFLRFNPDDAGVYIAHCAPDHFSLPALVCHFTQRFGNTPWLIIDEKRCLCLRCIGAGQPEFFTINEVPCSAPTGDAWEELWRQYHKTINNETRNNPVLQRRFIPMRYRKYLTEL